jgi:hypothetical protein
MVASKHRKKMACFEAIFAQFDLKSACETSHSLQNAKLKAGTGWFQAENRHTA